MKALVYTKNYEVTYRDEPDPTPRPGEVLVKIEAAGICGSDLHAYHGHDARRVPPLILGHEFAGTIASGPRRGERVAANPLVTCGACPYCETGRSNLCPERDMMGMVRPGAMAEYAAFPEKNLITLPKGLDPAVASLAEPLACAIHALDRARGLAARPLAELSALVIGGGAIGLLMGLCLKHYGCRRLTVSEPNPLRRQMVAHHLGCPVHDPKNEPPLPMNSRELVIDAVGGGATRRTALAAIRPGGVFVHIGLMDSQEGLDIRKLTLQEITMLGVYTYTMPDVRAAVALLAEGSLGGLGWMETRPLSEGAAAFQDLDQGRTPAAKLVLLPEA